MCIIKRQLTLRNLSQGEKNSDRTSGKSAIADFAKFAEAGITSIDTADIYGPSERLVGEYVQSLKAEERAGVQASHKHLSLQRCSSSPVAKAPAAWKMLRYRAIRTTSILVVQILTKCCFFYPQDMANPSVASVRKRIEQSTSNLATAPDLVQLYWHNYSIPVSDDCSIPHVEAFDGQGKAFVGRIHLSCPSTNGPE